LLTERELSLMNSEAQPMRITADTEPAKPWFVSWDLCRSAEAVHIGDRYFEVRHAEVHKKTPVRIAAMEAGLEGGSLKPSLSALAKWMEPPTEHLL
jgi:hypothetical protein